MRYSLQKDDLPFEPVTAGDGPISFDVPITLHPDGRMTGPFVRREGPTRRFVYIRIGTSAGDHASLWSRRAKIDIHDIPPAADPRRRSGGPSARPRQGRFPRLRHRPAPRRVEDRKSSLTSGRA